MKEKRLVPLFLCSMFFLLSSILVRKFPVFAADTRNYDYTFTTIDGNTVTSDGTGKKATLLVFGSAQCGITTATLEAIAGSDWSRSTDVAIIYIDVAGHTKEEVAELKNDIGGAITYCFDTGDTASYAMSRYYFLFGSESYISYPVIAFIDGENEVRNVVTGYQSSKAIVKEIESFTVITYDKSTYPTVSVEGTMNYEYVNEVVAQINTERKNEGISVLTLDTSLTDSAMQRAYELAMDFSHTRPNGEECFTAIEIEYSTAGENIAYGYRTPTEVVSGWMNSPGHRANILTDSFHAVGIGGVRIDGVYYWVQLFTDQAVTPLSKTGKVTATKTVELLPSLVNLSMDYQNSTTIGESSIIQLYNNGVKVSVEDAVFSASNNIVAITGNKVVAVKTGTADIMLTSNSLGIANKKMGTISVSPRSISSCTVILSTTKYTYNGKANTPAVTVMDGTKVLAAGVDFTLSYHDTVNAGTAKVKIIGKGNYTGTISKTFTIAASSISNAKVSGISNKTYTGKALTQGVTVKLGNVTLKNGTDYTLSYKNNTKVGTATVQIKGKGNYSGNINKSFVISLKKPVATVTAGTKKVTVKWKKGDGCQRI